MPKLAAFADEISPKLDEQIRVCKENGVTHFELRGVNRINVMDFDPALCEEIRSKLRDNGLAVACIGSPIGKAKVNDPWAPHFDRFKHAVDLAEFFGAPLIRVFSYYPPEGDDVRRHRDEVMRRMRAKAEYLTGRPTAMVHENERDIYGERGVECLDIVKTIDSPKLRAAFDFANFILCKENPLENWPLLKPYVTHIHIKDAKMDGGKIVPAGEGDGGIEEILVDAWKSGYDGFLTMEPHLLVAGHSHGETGPELFKVAVDAVKAICRRNGIPIRPA